MPTCNVDGCDDSAVGSVVGLDGYQRAYRCEECLLAALADAEPGPASRAHAIFACPDCEARVAVTNPESLDEAVVLCHCTQEYPRMEPVDGTLEVDDGE